MAQDYYPYCQFLTNGMKQGVGINCNCCPEFWNIDNLSLMHTHMHANTKQVMSHQDVQMAEGHKALSDPSAPWRDSS